MAKTIIDVDLICAELTKARGKKVTHKSLAEELGVSKQTLSNWNNGKNTMPILEVLKTVVTETTLELKEVIYETTD